VKGEGLQKPIPIPRKIKYSGTQTEPLQTNIFVELTPNRTFIQLTSKFATQATPSSDKFSTEFHCNGNMYLVVRFEIFMAVTMKKSVFWGYGGV
jgi:hypothetical protein